MQFLKGKFLCGKGIVTLIDEPQHDQKRCLRWVLKEAGELRSQLAREGYVLYGTTLAGALCCLLFPVSCPNLLTVQCLERLFFFFSSCCFRELSVLLCLSCLGVVRLPAQNSWAPPVTWLKRSLALTSSNAPLSFPPISWPASCFADDALPSTHLNLLCLRHSPVSSSSSLSLLLPDCWTIVPEAYAVIQKSPPCGSNPRTRWVSPSRWKSCRLDRCSYFLK